MLAKITVLTSLSLAALYPLCFWLSAKDPLKQGFHRFHLGFPCIILGIFLFYMIYTSQLHYLRPFMFKWTAALLFLTALYWNKPFPKPFLVTIPCVIGILAVNRASEFLIGPQYEAKAAIFSGALIFAAALYAMNLGHWYLNVHGLPIAHLVRATKCLAITLVLRLAWDAHMIISATVVTQGEKISVLKFMSGVDGFLAWLGVFFGTLFPLIGTYFAFGTLKLKNTQATTGILYVLLSSILLGEMTYKYYLIKFSLAL